MQIFSSAFQSGDKIPQKYGWDFADVNPPLAWSEVPDGTRSLALIMEDPDVPAAIGIPIFDHWVVFNIPPAVTSIPEAWAVEGVRGRGTRGALDYKGPRPPDREHRYFFKLLALDALLDLPEGATKDQVLAAAESHVLAQAELIGKFAPDGL